MAVTTRAAGVSSQIMTFQYDAAGNLIAETDPNGNQTVYGYDA
ncbi:RHS repeat domain-containing protein [Cohnella faecalis]|uniref:RHS repeat protein n=1 Tax=Cohnella faecalis TaxID=2315694 RepID=A0A398CV66_9BACL|nr:hypothetical protein D3H35_02075 [Cohnella faecalis]